MRRLGFAAALLLGVSLGASQLGRIAERPAGTESVPQAAESIALLCISPDDQMPSAADSSGMDLAPPDPFLDSAGANPKFVRQGTCKDRNVQGTCKDMQRRTVTSPG